MVFLAGSDEAPILVGDEDHNNESYSSVFHGIGYRTA
jgi:hypothetical protein